MLQSDWLVVLWIMCIAMMKIVPQSVCNIYVVVNFSSQVIFVFLLFLGMVMYANEVEQRKNENYLR